MAKHGKVATNLARFVMCGATGVLLMTAPAVRADIKYTQVMRMAEDAGNKNQQPLNSTTKYVRQGAERMETTMQMGPVKMQNISIRLCEKKQTIKIEPRLKIYTIAEDAPAKPAGATTAADKPTEAKTNKSGTGKMIITTNVQDLGEEEIAGFKTRHYMLTMRMQSSGCAGDSDNTMKMEIWTADIRDAVPCEQTGVDYKSMLGTSAKPTCQIDFEQKGDVAAVTKAYTGLVMRMKMYNGDKVSMIQEVSMLSQAKLTDDPFTIPAGYKQVSEEEFQKAQSQAMMQAIMEQAKNGQAGNGEDGDANEEKPEAKDEPETDKNSEENPEPKPQEKPKKRPKLPFKLPF